MSRFAPLRVLEVRPETADAFTIRFEKPAGPEWDYKPGQYVTLRAIINGKDERRAFSFSTSPSLDNHLAVTIKAIPGGVVSNHLRSTLKAGDTLDVMPPMGKFTLDVDPTGARHHVLIGGGSGITPLMSIIRAVLAAEPASRATLIYGNRDEASTIFRTELDALAAQHPTRFRLIHVFEAPAPGWAGATGRPSGEVLARLLDEALAGIMLPPMFYMCGPDGLMQGAQQELDRRGIAKDRVKREWYGAPLDASDAPTTVKTGIIDDAAKKEYAVTTQQVRIILDGREHTVTVKPKDHILDAALNHGIDPPYACQEGVCCTCRAKLLSGLVALDEREGLSDEELAQGYILTCQAHPLTADVALEYC